MVVKRPICLLVFLLLLPYHGRCFAGASGANSSVAANSSCTDNHDFRNCTANNTGHNEGGGHDGNGTEHHEHVSVHVARFDFASVRGPFVIAAVVLLSSVVKLIFHSNEAISSHVPESCLLIVFGFIIGAILNQSDEAKQLFRYSPQLFFQFLLPPIVLEAGYLMHKRYFFGNIGSILMYAVVGTLWNTFSVALGLYGLHAAGAINVPGLTFVEFMLTGTIVAAVDPVAVLAIFDEVHVNLLLYILVFGESLLNDAVSVVLYRTAETFVRFEKYNQPITGEQVVLAIVSFFTISLGGTMIGILWGMLASFITRFTDHVRVIETLMVFTCGYLAYLSAEVFHFSGIMSGISCGVVMRHYLNHNVSPKSRTTIKYCLKMLSSASETVIFMFLGLASIAGNYHWDTGFCIGTVVLAFIFRFVGVFVLTWVLNKKRSNSISLVDQFLMGYGGLRGAVSFSLVLLLDRDDVPAKDAIFTAVFTLIMFTVFIQATTVKPLVHFLHVRTYEPKKSNINELVHEKMMDHIAAGIEEIIGEYGDHFLVEYFMHMDNKFIKPVLSRPDTFLAGNVLSRLEKHFHCQTNRSHLQAVRRRSRDLLAGACSEGGEGSHAHGHDSDAAVCPLIETTHCPLTKLSPRHSATSPTGTLPAAHSSLSVQKACADNVETSVRALLAPSKLQGYVGVKRDQVREDQEVLLERALRLHHLGEAERKAAHPHGQQLVRSESYRNPDEEELCERRQRLCRRRCVSEVIPTPDIDGDGDVEDAPMAKWVAEHRRSSAAAAATAHHGMTNTNVGSPTSSASLKALEQQSAKQRSPTDSAQLLWANDQGQPSLGTSSYLETAL